MRVLIIEPYASGHHANYLRWLVQAAAKRNWNVVIASTLRALSHPSLSTITSEFKCVHVHPIQELANRDIPREGMFGLIRRELIFWRIFGKTVEEVRANMLVDALILPYVEYCFYALAVLGDPFKRLPWCAISMRLSVGRDVKDQESALPWKWRMTQRILTRPNLRALFVINPSVREVPSNWCPPHLRAELRYLPDPADFNANVSHSEARDILGVPKEALAILVFGSIDERKGIDALLAALASRDELSNCVVILAGYQSAGIRKLLTERGNVDLQAQGRLILLDRVVNDVEQALVLMAADVMWVGYRYHRYMSGVLVLAGKAGLPVVGTVEGEIGHLVAEHKLGAAVRIDNPLEVAHALSMLRDPELRRDLGRRAQHAFAEHTVENFGRTVLAAFDDLN